jgi:hypothetical protein
VRVSRLLRTICRNTSAFVNSFAVTTTLQSLFFKDKTATKQSSSAATPKRIIVLQMLDDPLKTCETSHATCSFGTLGGDHVPTTDCMSILPLTIQFALQWHSICDHPTRVRSDAGERSDFSLVRFFKGGIKCRFVF